MTYNKPAIKALGDAVRVIQGGKLNIAMENPIPPKWGQLNPPAYELDE